MDGLLALQAQTASCFAEPSQIALQPMLPIYIGRESPLIYQSDFFRANAAMTLSMPKSTRYTAGDREE